MTLRAGGFLLLSVGVHALALALMLADRASVPPAEGGGAAAMVLGTADADMTAGAMASAPMPTVSAVPISQDPTPPTRALPSQASEPISASPSPDTVLPVRATSQGEAVRDPIAGVDALAPAPSSIVPAWPAAIAPVAPLTAPGAGAPSAAPVAAAPVTAAVSSAVAPAAATPLPLSDPVALAAARRPAPADPALAPALDPQAPTRSLIPPERPRRAAEAPPVVAQGRRVTPSPGSAARDARRGAEAEAPRAQTRSGCCEGAADPGARGADAYAAAVMRRIRSIPAGRSSGRGSALVAFGIGPRGQLTSATIARSSGNPALDQAALAHIRRAAPFPPPPGGRSPGFTFEFVTR